MNHKHSYNRKYSYIHPKLLNDSINSHTNIIINVHYQR